MKLGAGRVSDRGGDPGRAGRRAARSVARPRRRGHGDVGRRLRRDQLVRPAAPPGDGARRAQPALPVVGPGRAAGGPARAQHHLHRLRGGAPDGQGGLPYQPLGPGLGVDGTAVGLRRGRALLRQDRRPLRPPPPLPVRSARGHGERGPHRVGAHRGLAPLRPRPGRRAGRGHRHRVDGDHPGALRSRGPGQGAGLVVVGRGGRPRARRHAGLAGDPVLRVAHPLLGPARAAGHRVAWWWRCCCPRRGARSGPPGKKGVGRARARTSGRAWTGWAAGAWPAR